jgi:hypothetical protein
MSQVCAHPTSYTSTRTSVKAAAAAWVVAAVYYFYQYALRSAPSVMMPQLSEAFGVSALGVASIVGLFYYGYSPFSLVAGAAMDRMGPRKVLPVAAVVVGVGALLFATGNSAVASLGRFLQGAGGVFALVGAIYIATKNFPPSKAATLIGATQMFGMAGGSAGQFVVGPMIAGGVAWNRSSSDSLTQRKRKGAASWWIKEHHGQFLHRVQKSAVNFVRSDCRPAFYSYHHLRHGLGGSLSPGGARPCLCCSGNALRCGSFRMDHRLPLARLHL